MVAAWVNGFWFHDDGSMGGRRIPWRTGGGNCNNVDPVRNHFLDTIEVHIAILDTDPARRSRPLR
jgi:hypothetical protein